MSLSASFPEPRFGPHPLISGEENLFATIHVDTARVMASYRKSLFAYEWLDDNGHVKSVETMADGVKSQYRQVEKTWGAGGELAQPVLGMGLLECVEMGAGRDVFLTLAAHGVKSIPVHVPLQMVNDFHKYLAHDKTSASKQSQHGNILFYILIAIILIAALSVAISGSTRTTSVGTVTDNQASLAVTEIMTYGTSVRDAVARLRLRGCFDTEIGFENDTDTGYAGSGIRDQCQIFNSTGGGLVWKTPPTVGTTGSYVFTVGNHVIGVGTGSSNATQSAGSSGISDVADYLMIVKVDRNVCLKANDKLGLKNDIPADGGSFSLTKYNGSIASPTYIGGQQSEINGQQAMCFCNGSDANCTASPATNYYLYQVLMAR